MPSAANNTNRAFSTVRNPTVDRKLTLPRWGPRRDRIEPPGMPGVTPGDAPKPHQDPARTAVRLYRLQGICRAGGIETALAAHERAQEALVSPDEPAENRLQRVARWFQCHSRDFRRDRSSEAASLPWAMTTKSKPPSWPWCSRKLSRTRRLTRFRSWARGTRRREMAIPKRGWPRPFGAKRTTNRLSWERQDSAKSFVNSRLRVSRRERGKRASRIGARRSGAEPLAALGPPGLQDLSSTAGGHPGAEAVPALALEVTGLKGLLHVGTALRGQ